MSIGLSRYFLSFSHFVYLSLFFFISRALEAASSRDPGLIIRNPLVILDGSNHAIFIGDDLPSPLHEFDIDPEVDQLEVLREAVDLISLFITNTLQEPTEAVKRARETFARSFEHAQNITEVTVL